tara:strand:- start:2732 stop:3418 length:687 start_codon:yes stop_codon:yes gene_type:complete
MEQLTKIHIVESTSLTSSVFKEALNQDGFLVELISREEVINKAKSEKPALILLPVELDVGDGIELCYEIKNNPDLQGIFVILYSKQREEFTQIAGLDSGADDFLTSPIQAQVLYYKIKAILKRRPLGLKLHYKGNELLYNDLFIDKDRYLIVQNGEEFYLPKKEFELLSLLLSKPQKVFSRAEITNAVWGDISIVKGRTIDVHIRKIREKIGRKYIQTIKGVGYRLES